MATSVHQIHSLRSIMAAASHTSTLLKVAIEACLACEEACNQSAEACGEGSADLDRARRLAQDCAASCRALARALGNRDDELVLAQIAECARNCAICGAESQNQARRNAHFQRAADACLSCEEACRALLRRWHFERRTTSPRP